MSQPPGEAQFSFSEATLEIAGGRVKAALAVMMLPYSDALFVSAYPRECTEIFQAGHVAVFSLFGGIPTTTAYDNTSIAVSKIVGSERLTGATLDRLTTHRCRIIETKGERCRLRDTKTRTRARNTADMVATINASQAG